MMTWFTIYFKLCNVKTFDNVQHTNDFADLDNAKFVAKKISACADVAGAVDIVDANTGEVMATYEKGKATYVA